MTDRELLDRCIAGAPGAWEEFLLRFRPVLRRTAAATLQRALGSAAEDDVEAVVEAVLIAVVKDGSAALRAFAGRSSLAGYLRAVAAKNALNHLRSEKRKGWLRFRPLEASPEPVAAEPETASDPAQLAKLRQVFELLPPRDRLLLKLFHLDGTSYREIARLLGIPVNTVSPTLIRAREKLRVLMADSR